MIKYNVSFDGILPVVVEMYIAQSYASEEFALLEAILKQVVKDTEHRNIYLIDRGVQSTRLMKKFSENISNLLSELKKTVNTNR